MKSVLSLLLISLCISSFAHSNDFNLDFEKIKDNKPVGWQSYGTSDDAISIDQVTVQNGKNALSITNPSGKPKNQNWSVSLPAKYQGEKITLSGYIKTENVNDGVAGFAMSITPSIAFDAMQDREITGTTDWKRYEISLDLQPQKAEEIIFSAYLTGTGKMWVDNIHLSIDGKPIESASLREFTLAEKDTEFNKGSNIILGVQTEQRLDNLALLGKVWGFLKYHHPEIAKGNYNWDYELFRLLPKYQKVTTNTARDLLLLQWIDNLGKVALCKTCKQTAPDAFIKPDLDWLNAYSLSNALQQKLKFIYNNRHQGPHFYVEAAVMVGNPIFNHEKSYVNMPYPDDGFRLLSLYRYWNMIHYYLPNKHLTDKDWRGVLKQHIQVFINASTELEYEIAALQLISEINDTHANVFGGHNKLYKWRGQYRAPMVVEFIENQLTVTDYYNPDLQQKAGLQIGDVITKINGVTVTKAIKQQQPYTPASNYPRQLGNISKKILRSSTESIQITYLSGSKEFTKQLTLYKLQQLNLQAFHQRKKDVPSIERIDNEIGYVNLISIEKSDIEKIKQEFKDTKGIIVDIRNYPNAFVVHPLAAFFTTEPTPWVKLTKMNLNNPGEFNFMQAIETDNTEESYRGKLIVIVNEKTLSQAEFTAMALRAGDNTTIIGSTTAGADGDVSTIYLPGNIKTKISGLGVYYPDGTETQRVGIVPDIEVLPTIAGIKAGRDELLEKAIELIKL